MVMLELRGRINESGKLELDLPRGVPSGDVKVMIEITEPEDVEWTDEEIAELLQEHQPMSGAEIVAMIESGELATDAWTAITDSTAWVEDLRRRDWESRWSRE